jgi:hypothetical protein
MTKRLYLLKRHEEFSEYDTYEGFLIRETSQRNARRIAQQCDTGDSQNTWIDKSKSSCKVITNEGPRTVIISDFRAA